MKPHYYYYYWNCENEQGERERGREQYRRVSRPARSGRVGSCLLLSRFAVGGAGYLCDRTTGTPGPGRPPARRGPHCVEMTI